MTWTTQAIYSNLKAILSDATGLKPSEIRAIDSLSETLGLTVEAVRGLTPNLQVTFAPQPRFKPSDVGACEIVRDLFNLIREALGV